MITATVTVLPDAYPAISNTATVTSATPEDPSTLADNTSTVTTPVPARSELAITKEITGVLEAGFGGEYTITVTNLGPTPDPGPVLVTDVLASALTFERAELDGTAIECEVTGQVVVCDVGPLEVDQRATLVLNVRVGASATGEIENVASVSSQDRSPSPRLRRRVRSIDRYSQLPAGRRSYCCPWRSGRSARSCSVRCC